MLNMALQLSGHSVSVPSTALPHHPEKVFEKKTSEAFGRHIFFEFLFLDYCRSFQFEALQRKMKKLEEKEEKLGVRETAMAAEIKKLAPIELFKVEIGT